jgi:hypothetical protein
VENLQPRKKLAMKNSAIEQIRKNTIHPFKKKKTYKIVENMFAMESLIFKIGHGKMMLSLAFQVHIELVYKLLLLLFKMLLLIVVALNEEILSHLPSFAGFLQPCDTLINANLSKFD